MAKDDEKERIKKELEEKKKQLRELISKYQEKKIKNQEKVTAQRKELEMLNNTRNSLYSSLSTDERIYQEKNEEKNQLIMQKSLKLTELAEKEKQLHEKEYQNKQLKEKLEALKLRAYGISHEQDGVKHLDHEENRRLDKKLNEKFQKYHDLMAPHRIDETASEMSASVLSANDRKGSMRQNFRGS